MITVYDLQADYGLIKTYLSRAEANRHIKAIENRSLLVDHEWVKVIPRETDTLSSQRILVEGDTVGYQFSKHRNGRRTVVRRVQDLKWDNGQIGIAYWQGRILKVRYDPYVARCKARRADSDPGWYVEALVGYC